MDNKIAGNWSITIYIYIKSGVLEGNIYNAIVSHSEDYGSNFLPHTYNGFFGNLISSEIDNEENIGYTIVNKTFVPDTIYLLITYDNFENLATVNTFNYNSGDYIYISRGTNFGELYLYNKIRKQICFSNSYGIDFTLNNTLNLGDLVNHSIVGGLQEGELYFLVNSINMMGLNANIYILHSIDYGITYEVFHPFAKGQEPLLANFSAKSVENNNSAFNIKAIDSVYYVTGDMPMDAHFYNYSIGNINSYEWDFNNDGLIDSYEENPVFIFSDTGWYSVNLTVYDDYDTNSFLRENYVYVYELTGTDEISQFDKPLFSCYPNPFNENITITFPDTGEPVENEILIYDIKGRIVQHLISDRKNMVWDGSDKSGAKSSSGIYFIKFKNHNYTEKVLLTN